MEVLAFSALTRASVPFRNVSTSARNSSEEVPYT
jgi:hypothetical protein